MDYCATLYRYYDGDGVLLYVGVSQEALGRLEGHRRCKEWYYDIKSIRLEHYEVRYEALCAERRAIMGRRSLRDIGQATWERPQSQTRDYAGLAYARKWRMLCLSARSKQMTNKIQTEAAALAASKGYSASQITKINLADDGSLASVELGVDADGFGIFVLNFAL